MSEIFKARVTKSTGSWYDLLDEKGNKLSARIRGKFRLDGIKSTNPIAVGDWVDFISEDGESHTIVKIHERNNYIIRRSVNLSKQTHIIASNIDLACLVITLSKPKTSLGFIDRFLITTSGYEIPTLLVFNKTDTWTKELQEEAEYYQFIYESLGYETIEVSSVTKEGIGNLKNILKNKVSVFSGHSGVGKSTLVNSLSPDLNLKTKEVSDFNDKGQHTTTFAQMFPWDFGGFIIDTPGIKEFGLVKMEKHEIGNYFPEIFALKSECKFNNCLHLNEPKCRVKQAVENGEIAPSRYENYLGFLEEEWEKW